MYFTIYGSAAYRGRVKADIITRLYLSQDNARFFVRASDGINGHNVSPRLPYEQALVLYNAYSTYLFGEDVNTLFPELQI